jgi:sentrin-specific protease 1
MEKIFIPINQHWTLAVINVAKQQFEYFDSMIGKSQIDPKYVRQILQRYIECEANVLQVPLNAHDWKLIVHDLPQQNNSYDCGVFMCAFAERASIGGRIIVTPDDISELRKKIAICIIHCRL